MSTLVTILHVVVCLFLMLTVLLQQGKGGGMGGAFGGSNAGSVFGGAGASTFLRRLTAAAATVFMLTSMILAFVASRDAGDSLERYSNSEAAKRKRAKEAERKAFDTNHRQHSQLIRIHQVSAQSCLFTAVRETVKNIGSDDHPDNKC